MHGTGQVEEYGSKLVPLSKYNKYMGDGPKVMANLQKQYGYDKGRMVFYAMVNKRKKKK